MWARLDDGFPDHPKLVQAGPLAGWLFVCGLCYAARYLTNGFVPEGQLRKLADVDDPVSLAARLVEVGLWEPTDGGWQIHDFTDYNPTAEKVEEERAKAKERMRERRSGEVRANTGRTSASPSSSSSSSSYPVPVQERAATADAATAPADQPHRSLRADPLYDGLVSEFGEPSNQVERGRYNKAIKLLRESGAQADEIAEAIANYRRAWPKVACTPIALASHWSQFKPVEEYDPRSDPNWQPPPPVRHVSGAWRGWVWVEDRWETRDVDPPQAQRELEAI